jgi:TPR repeat protein
MGLRSHYGHDDDAEALAWFAKASAQRQPDAMFHMARGGDLDRELLIGAADLGSADAQRALGVYYSTGEEGFPLDAAQGQAWYRRAAENGNVESMYDYGFGLLLGDGGVHDVAEGIRWLERAASADPPDAGSESAAGVLADGFESGLWGVPVDPDASARWRAREEELKAYWRVWVGRHQLQMALDDLSGPRDLGSVEAAAKAGDAVAMRVLAIVHDAGIEGHDPDPIAARRWYERAANAGDVHAMYDLGRMLLHGRGGPADPIGGVAWLERAAKADPPHDFASRAAASTLWQLYANGTWGVEKDPQKAAFWERRR